MIINRDSGERCESESDDVAVRLLDARGLRCPLPLLKAKQLLAQVQPGDCIRVLATDAGSVRDFHTFAKLAGHHMCHFREYDGIYEYLLKKGSYV